MVLGEWGTEWSVKVNDDKCSQGVLHMRRKGVKRSGQNCHEW